MIGFVRGKVISRREDQIIVDVNDVGYQVTVPTTMAGVETGSDCELYIHTHVREDALELFGFTRKSYRQMFQELLTVSGIGPRVALNIISTLSPDRFARAILNEDLNILKEVKGIGPKSGQRMILELKSRVDDLMAGESFSDTAASFARDDELYSALNNLGYSDSEVNSALEEMEIESQDNLEEKIRQVLLFLGQD